MLARAVFSLDTFELLNRADAVVVNLNGRVPDEGAVVEAALAWHSGKALVLYKKDARSKLAGEDNPMITGLGRFCVCSSIADLPTTIRAEFPPDRASEMRRRPSPLASGWRRFARRMRMRRRLPGVFDRIVGRL